MANPYADWNAGQRGTSHAQVNFNPPPSIYGALPFVSHVEEPPALTFSFTAYNPCILNCTVLGPNCLPQFRVVTDPAMPGYTLLKTLDGRSSALVEWQQPPKIEIRGAVFKQPTPSFLRLSSNHRYRIMVIGNQEFMWLPDRSSICLYNTNSSDTTPLARIYKNVDIITLEVTQTAIRAGLLNTCVVTTVLLQCGRSID